MDRISDKTFGELEYDEDYDRFLRKYEFELFSQVYDIVLIVEGNGDENEIYPEQRIGFERLEQNAKALAVELEKALFDYYRKEISEVPESFEELPIANTQEELSNLLELRWIRFPMVYDKGKVLFGFLFDCQWDPEHGLAARYDEQVLSIGSQDILA